MENQGVKHTASSSPPSLSSATLSLPTSSNLTLAGDVEQSTTRESEPLELEFITKDHPKTPSDGEFTSTSGTPKSKAEMLIEGHCCAAVPTPDSAVQAGDHSGDYPHGGRLMGILGALLISLFLVYLDITIIGTAVPKITDEFKSLDHVSWYGSAYFMTMGGLQPSWGKAYKYFPLKVTYLLAVCTLEIGSLICGAAPESLVLVIGRAIVGIGAAGIVTGTFTIIAFVASPEKRPLFTGLIGGVYGIACLLGPLLGGAFADKGMWRWCFYISLPLGSLAVLIILILFRTPSRSKPIQAPLGEKLLQLDPAGLFLLMGAVLAYFLAMKNGEGIESWHSSITIGLLSAFGTISIVFIGWEVFLGERAMIAPWLIRQRVVWLNCLYAFFFGGSYYIICYYLPIYFQSVAGMSPTVSGLYNLPILLATSAFMAISGAVVSALGNGTPAMAIAAAIATLGVSLLYTLDTNSTASKWISYQILAGIGYGLGFQVPLMMVQDGTKPQDLAAVTAMILFSAYLGGSFLVVAAQAAFVSQLIAQMIKTIPGIEPSDVVNTGATEIRHKFDAAHLPVVLVAYMSGLKTAFAIAVGGISLAFLVSLLNRWSRPKNAAPSPAGEDAEAAA